MTPRRLGIALGVSLFANVFAVGIIAGGLVMLSRSDPAIVRPVAGRPIRSAGQDLPPPDRERFGRMMAQTLATSREFGRSARESRQEAAELLVAPQFDRAAAAAALDRARQADFALRSRLETAALDFAATLPAAERATLATGLEHGGPLRRARP